MSRSYLDHVAPLLMASPPTHRLALGFADDRVQFLSNSEALTQTLRDYYRDFLAEDEAPPDVTVTALEGPPLELELDYTIKQPEPGKTSLKEEYKDYPDGRVVHKLKTGMVFLFGAAGRYAAGPCLENHAQVVNFINNSVIELHVRRGALLFHAAGVAKGGKGVCIAGFSGAGKSTLALEIMRHGKDFVSNDRIMVRRDGQALHMTGVAKMPRVNPGTVLHNESLWPVMPAEDRRRFAALPQEELWELEHKYDAFIDTCFGPGRFLLQSKMAGLVLLNWRREEAPLCHDLVDLKQRPDLMPSFMKSVGLFVNLAAENEARQPDLDAGEEQYLELLRDCPVLEITGGIDFQAAAERCLELLDRWP